MENCRDSLHNVLINGEFEDIDREMEIALHHLNKADNPKRELDLLLKGLKHNIPVPYIIGYTCVCGLEIKINEHVLHPGPETLILTEKAVGYIDLIKQFRIKVLDLCTGSGVIAIVIAINTDAEVTATDISISALEIARLNASINKAGIQFMIGDLFGPVVGRKFNIIICNPPYVRTDKIQSLPRFILNFSPILAVDGSEEGMFFHRAILSQAKQFLHKGGCLFLEYEYWQDCDLENLCVKYDWAIKSKFRNKRGEFCGFQLFLR